MTSRMPSRLEQVAPPSHTGARVAAGVVGTLTLAAGIVLLIHPVAAAGALALLIGGGLVVAGVFEIVVEWGSGHRGVFVTLGGVLVIGGLLALVWPRVTLFALAVITGLTLIVHGLVRVVVALATRERTPRSGWLVLVGVVNVVFGIAALVWPHATVLVLSLILGLQIVLFAIVMLIVAFAPSRAEEAGW